MKLYISAFIYFSINTILFSQERERHDIGAFFVALKNRDEIVAPNIEKSYLWEYYMNITYRYRVLKKLYAGAEYNYAVITGDQQDGAPFYIIGLFSDYDIFQHKGLSFTGRLGLSNSNLSFAGDEAPTRRNIINRIFGIHAELKIHKAFWIQLGYFNHYPLNKIKYKYGIAHPVLGLRVKF
jgi:hypothetical protein